MKKYKPILFVILFFIVSDLVLFFVVPPGVWDKKTGIPVSDCAVILYAGPAKKATSSNIDNESMRRLNFAVELYKKGAVSNFVFTSGSRLKHGELIASVLMAQIAAGKGVNRQNIFYETNSYDTKTNLAEAMKIIKQNLWNTVLVISSGIHLKRAKFLAKRKRIFNRNLKITYLPYDYSGTLPRINRLHLWLDFHYNIAAYIFHFVMPEKWYDELLRWSRT